MFTSPSRLLPSLFIPLYRFPPPHHPLTLAITTLLSVSMSFSCFYFFAQSLPLQLPTTPLHPHRQLSACSLSMSLSLFCLLVHFVHYISCFILDMSVKHLMSHKTTKLKILSTTREEHVAQCEGWMLRAGSFTSCLLFALLEACLCTSSNVGQKPSLSSLPGGS